MFKKKKKCVVCENKILEKSIINKYESIFCGQDCLKKYEELLEEAKKTSKIG